MAAAPKIACEISADRVVAARAADREPYVEVYSVRTLPAGAVRPSLTAGNIADRDAVRGAVANALATVGGRSRDLIAVLPDAAVRVTLLDFETLPERRDDAEALVRFRLKKSLPFDVDRAALSFHVARANGNLRVVAAVAPRAVVQEYESVFSDEGYSPGIVLPSALAALGNIEGEQPTLVIKVDAVTITVAIVEQRQLRLLRVLENPAGADIRADQLAAEIYPSIVFFEDTFQTKVQRVLLAGIVGPGQVTSALEAQAEVRAQELVSGRAVAQGFGESGQRGVLAAVVGALVG